jgi:hypothetical protein
MTRLTTALRATPSRVSALQQELQISHDEQKGTFDEIDKIFTDDRHASASGIASPTAIVGFNRTAEQRML